MASSVVILTGNQLRHRFFVNRIARSCDVRGVVLEEVAPQPAQDDEDVRHHFDERDRVEQEMFGADERVRVDAAAVRSIAKGQLDDGAVFDWVLGRESSSLVLFGSGIVGDRYLAAFESRCFNLHLGLSPYYRGSGTNFWPLVNREPEFVGATIHVPTPVVDGGPILWQGRPRLEPADRCHQIGCKAIEIGADLMAACLEIAAQRPIGGRVQSSKGRFYRRRDFTPDAVRTMWRHFDAGMIPEYLADPARADVVSLVQPAGDLLHAARG